MSKTANGWEVIDGEGGVLSREYTFSKDALARMMTARAADGSLVAISPACRMDDGAFKDLEEFGEVKALIAPNGFHHMGIGEWHGAFPQARLFAPPDAAKRIHKKFPELGSFADLGGLRLGDKTRALEVPAQRIGETWLTAKTDAGNVWYVSDTCFSMSELPKPLVGRLAFKWSQSAPGFRVNRLSLWMFARDKPAYKRWILERLEEETPDVIVTAHGEVLRGPELAAQFRAEVEKAF